MDYTEEQYNSITRAYEQVCRNATPAGWNAMTLSERVAEMQAVENFYAMQQNRAPAVVSAQDIGTILLGEQEAGQIHLSQAMLEQDVQSFEEILDIVRTVGHEGSHERDTQAMTNPEVAAQYPEGEVEARNKNYISYEENPVKNANHPAEVAARIMEDRCAARFVHDQALIAVADQQYLAEQECTNPVLVTFDYNALDYAGEHGLLPPSPDDDPASPSPNNLENGTNDKSEDTEESEDTEKSEDTEESEGTEESEDNSEEGMDDSSTDGEDMDMDDDNGIE